MVTRVQGYRLSDKLSAVITSHQTVMKATTGKPITRTEALEDILNRFREAKQTSPLEKVSRGLEAFIHG
jgi:hypothetical protein